MRIFVDFLAVRPQTKVYPYPGGSGKKFSVGSFNQQIFFNGSSCNIQLMYFT